MVVRSTKLLTYEDYARFLDDGRRYELIEGEAFMVPSPDVAHQDLVLGIARRIGNYLDQHGGGRVFIAPLDVVLSDLNVVQPDVIFVAEAQRDIITDENIRGVPIWLIEVVSDPVRDQKVKRDIYLQSGVDEYWAVVREPASIEVFRPQQQPVLYERPARVSPACLPGLEIDLTELFSA